MSHPPLARIAAAAAAAIGLTVAAGTPALAFGRDTTPPTAPFLVYAQGYYCGVLIVGMSYGYFGSRDLFRLGLLLTLVQCVLLLLLVFFYWPLIGLR